ncbi:UNVERIFIED_CONTAM: hypothetical protein GTU68_066220 [Idotea baltica]|nr:hypothetical protein [Idotea baltica]
MKVLLTPDKFKGSLSAQEVCAALEKGLKRANPNVTIVSRPLADGGDGSLEILGHYLELKTQSLQVQDPLGRPIFADYKIARNTAYIEMSMASGLVLLKPEERNCMYTSSFGTGELIADSLTRRVKEIYLFIGGSATNDGGIGIAQALGYRFYDVSGNLLKPTGENLSRIDKIDDSEVRVELKEVPVHLVCDVNNPFWGENGAAYVYAAQKGANTHEIALLDQGLKNLADCLVKHSFPDVAHIPGAGAAGGVGGGCIAFLHADLISGIQTFLKIAELEKLIQDSDLVITGEGKLDAQTENGKVVSGVCELAQKYDVPVIAVCGAADEKAAEKLPIQQIYTVLSRSISIEEAMTKAAEKLEAIALDILNTNI